MDLPLTRKLSIPYFLPQSLIECGTNLNAGVPDQLAHYGLIKQMVEDALHTYTIPIAWEIFIVKTATTSGCSCNLLEFKGSFLMNPPGMVLSASFQKKNAEVRNQAKLKQRITEFCLFLKPNKEFPVCFSLQHQMAIFPLF